MKACRVCRLSKLVEEFAIATRNRDGRCNTCKSCVRTYSASHYQRNRDRILADWKEWRRGNPEEAKAKGKRSRERNGDSARAATTAWYWANREYVLRKQAERYTANPDHVKAIIKRWEREHPEYKRLACNRRRAAKRGASESHTSLEWLDKLKEYAGRCHWCGRDTDGKPERDHVIPLSRGGSDGIDNVVPCCVTCNRRKGSKLPREWANERHRISFYPAVQAIADGRAGGCDSPADHCLS